MQSVSFFTYLPYTVDPFIENASLLAEKKENFLYIEQKYGGHLGFYEGGYVIPNQITWLDKSVVSLADALAAYASSGKQVNATNLEDEEEITTFAKELTPANDEDEDDDVGAESDNSGGGEEEFFATLLSRPPRMEVKGAAKHRKRRSSITFVCKKRRLSVASSRQDLVSGRMVI